MADTAITVAEPEPESEPRRAVQSTQPTGILMTHSHVPQNPNTIILGFNFNPMEDSRRIIADNLSTTIGEISPLINLSRSVCLQQRHFKLYCFFQTSFSIQIFKIQI